MDFFPIKAYDYSSNPMWWRISIAVATLLANVVLWVFVAGAVAYGLHLGWRLGG